MRRPTTDATATIGGLDPDTSYMFRVTASNSAGSGDSATTDATTDVTSTTDPADPDTGTDTGNATNTTPDGNAPGVPNTGLISNSGVALVALSVLVLAAGRVTFAKVLRSKK